MSTMSTTRTVPSMSGINVIATIESLKDVRHDPHYRRTIQGPMVCTEVFVEIKASWQTIHQHYFQDIAKDGYALCHGCGAVGWCESWVADGIQISDDGEDLTYGWADTLYRNLAEKARNDEPQVTSLTNLAKRARGIAVDINADQPAKLH